VFAGRRLPETVKLNAMKKVPQNLKKVSLPALVSLFGGWSCFALFYLMGGKGREAQSLCSWREQGAVAGDVPAARKVIGVPIRFATISRPLGAVKFQLHKNIQLAASGAAVMNWDSVN
jgi:hypothetical protein